MIRKFPEHETSIWNLVFGIIGCGCGCGSGIPVLPFVDDDLTPWM
jgi:hypothetical protein